jgi:hypothetical protein
MDRFDAIPLEGLNLLSEYALREWQEAEALCEAARAAGDRDTEIDQGLRANRASEALHSMANLILIRQMSAGGERLCVGND